MAEGYSELANGRISAANGIDYAYRDTGGGEGGAPLVLFQHFRGNLDSWDPALIDALASARRVITFDNAGVGGSTGTTLDTIEQMARDAIAFLAAMEFSQADLLGFSIGSFVAQQIALTRPAIVRRLVLASAAPQGAAGMHGWAPEVIGAIGHPETSPGEYLGVFRPDDPAALLLPPGRPDPAGTREDLPRLSARVPVPAPRGLCSRRRGLSQRPSLTGKGHLQGGGDSHDDGVFGISRHARAAGTVGFVHARQRLAAHPGCGIRNMTALSGRTGRRGRPYLPTGGVRRPGGPPLSLHRWRLRHA